MHDALQGPLGAVSRDPVVAVVGDSEHVQGCFSTVSEDLAFETVDSDEAVQAVDDGDVDCVVTVAHEDALAVLELVREQDSEIPFVVFSDSLNQDEVVEAGATEHVSLPLDDGRGVGRRLRRYAEGRKSKRAERELNSFLRHTPDQILVHDADGEILDVNRQVCEALGYDRDEIVGMNVSEIEVGASPEELKEAWSEYEYGDSVVIEGRHRRKDGTEFPVEVNVGKVRMDGDERFLAIARDITEREMVQKSLKRLRREHETVFENVQDPVFFVEVEDGGEKFVFRRLNPAYEEQVGITETEARGRTPREVFGEEAGAELAENYRQCVEEGRTLNYEETLEVPVGERVYHTKITPVRSGGKVTAIVGSARDITERVERERELKRYETYVENASDIISHLDTDGTVLYQSPAVERVLGVEQDEWIGENVFEHVHPDDRARVVRQFAELAEGDHTVENVEFRMENEDGSYVWIEAVGTDWRDSELGGVVVSSRDVTERKEKEQELQRYRKIIENFSDMVTLLDGDGTILYNSPSVEEALGYGPDENVGRNTFEFVHPDDRQHVLQQFSSLVTESEKKTENVEFRMRHKDGSYVWVEAVGADRRDTELDAVVVNTRDITERKNRERELERSRDLLRRTEQMGSTGGWEIDLRDDEIRWTDGTREICGVGEEYEPTLEEVIGFYVPEDQPKIEEAIERCREEGEPFDKELRIQRRDGEERWVRSRGEAVREDGETVRLRGAVHDITERKEREKALEEQKNLVEKRKEQIQFFNSLLRHDMLNSMTVIRGNAGRLVDELPEGEARDDAEKIHSRADDIVDLTNRVRSVLRRITEEGSRELAPYDLAEIAEERGGDIGDVYDVDVTVETPEEAYVEADEFLDDVVDNLLINAVEHNDKEEPRVDLTVERGDETTVLRVADNGPGIPDRMKEAVFGQGEKGRSSGGVGFGLYFVESMVSEYGGDVRVKDNEPEGAVVVVELPNAEGGER
jgi:PAS domain S-box-containing protein